MLWAAVQVTTCRGREHFVTAPLQAAQLDSVTAVLQRYHITLSGHKQRIFVYGSTEPYNRTYRRNVVLWTTDISRFTPHLYVR